MRTSEALKFSSAWYRSKGKDDIFFSGRGPCSMVTKNSSFFFFLLLVSMRLALREPVVASLAHGQPESEKETWCAVYTCSSIQSITNHLR